MPGRQPTARPTAASNYPKINSRRVSSLSLLDPLLSVLRGCGLRVGEALRLRHEDIDARRAVVMVRRRANVNRARAKTWEREVPADAGLIRLYSDYLHEEYGPLDCDSVAWPT